MSKKLSLFQALPLGIGSIIGSGILFLPSLTYKVSGSDVGLAWLLTIVVCIPGVIFFKDMLDHVKPETGMAGFVEVGLGSYAGNSVYLLLLSTVIIGMPSAAIIAGDYLQYLEPNQQWIRPVVTYGLLSVALLVNLGGIKTSSKVSFVVAVFLFIVAVGLIYLSSKEVKSFEAIRPDFNISKTYSGIVLAFWAFAGFENLTFLYHKFKNPKRDLVITILVSVISCGALYVGLMANYASLIPIEKVKSTIGLLQIAALSSSSELKIIISVFAFLAVLINLVSWTSGVVSMIISGSEKGLMPGFIKKGNANSKGTVFLGFFFFLSATVGLYQRYLFEDMLSLVSTNFLIIYSMGIVSYMIFIKNSLKKFVAGFIATALTLTLTSSGLLLIYPLCMIFISTLASMKVEAKRIAL